VEPGLGLLLVRAGMKKLRLRPGLLRSMGWEYQRVHALEIFAKPQDVANRIAVSLGVDLVRKAQPLLRIGLRGQQRAWGHGG